MHNCLCTIITIQKSISFESHVQPDLHVPRGRVSREIPLSVGHAPTSAFAPLRYRIFHSLWFHIKRAYFWCVPTNTIITNETHCTTEVEALSSVSVSHYHSAWVNANKDILPSAVNQPKLCLTCSFRSSTWIRIKAASHDVPRVLKRQSHQLGHLHRTTVVQGRNQVCGSSRIQQPSIHSTNGVSQTVRYNHLKIIFSAAKFVTFNWTTFKSQYEFQ